MQPAISIRDLDPELTNKRKKAANDTLAGPESSTRVSEITKPNVVSWAKLLIFLVAPLGVEPSTNGLKVETIEITLFISIG